MNAMEIKDITNAYRILHKNLQNSSRDFKLIVKNSVKIILHEFHATKLERQHDDFKTKYQVRMFIGSIALFRSTEVVVELEGVLKNCMEVVRRIAEYLIPKPLTKGLKVTPYNVLQYNESKAYDSLSYKFDDLVFKLWNQVDTNVDM